MNNFSRKSKALLCYWKQLKLNNKGILVKVTSKNKQLVLLQNYHSIFYTELHKNETFETQKSFDLVKTRLYWPYNEKDIHGFVKKNEAVNDIIVKRVIYHVVFVLHSYGFGRLWVRDLSSSKQSLETRDLIIHD